MNRRLRFISMMALDVILINLAVYIMLLLRFDGNISKTFVHNFLLNMPLFSLVTLGFLISLKLYHRVWEYASIGEMMAIVRAITYSMAVVVLITFTFRLPSLPRSVYIGSWCLMVMIIGASRVWWRVFRDLYINRNETNLRRVMVVGGGAAGAILINEIKNSPQYRLKVVGIVDDDPAKQKMILQGVPILGSTKSIEYLAREYEVDEIIIAMPSVSGEETRPILEQCYKTKARVRILPGVYQSSDSLVKNIRDVAMEDLLRRQPITGDLEAIAGYIRGKSVLVTGGGGSIGSELCRQLIEFDPAKLIILDYSENNLFDIEVELRAANPGRIWTELVDVKCLEKIQEVFRFHKPQVVFHAAAFKHVPMMQRHPDEALNNNVMGTRNVASMADKYKAETFIFISTDKAVNPTSIMGASKRISELVVKDIGQNSKTRFASVRFGNVLGSRGSVIPTFMKQIQNGGPVTVTHPDMTRYFMTIPEAVQLVIQAGAMAQGGETFVLDMGEPVKIDDLARDLIRLSGFQPDEDISVVYTGIRPGEKLYEELFTGQEEIAATMHRRIFISKRDLDLGYQDIAHTVELIKKLDLKNREDAIQMVSRLLPEFAPAPPSATGHEPGLRLVEPSGDAKTSRMVPVPNVAAAK